MSIHDEIVTHTGGKYKVIKIAQENISDLKELIKDCLVDVCFGAEGARIEPDTYTYTEACRQLYSNLDRYDDVKRYGLIGELLMHVLAPGALDFEAESMSMVLALQNQNVKPGFDLNFHDKNQEKIWYGEVKSGLNHDDRKVLIARARDGLRNYFDNIDSAGEKSTSYRWDAAKHEVAVIFAAKERATLSQLLTSDRTSISTNSGKRRNAILMTVSFGDSSYELSTTQDIEESINNLVKLNCFDDYLVINIHKQTFDDIIDFLKTEGRCDE